MSYKRLIFLESLRSPIPHRSLNKLRPFPCLSVLIVQPGVWMICTKKGGVYGCVCLYW